MYKIISGFSFDIPALRQCFILAIYCNMILEIAKLDVKIGQCEEFESAFKQAQMIISSMPGYISHQLHRCIESPNRYVLLVQWDKLEDHTVGFRQSKEYQEWKKLLHHFYDHFPTVGHYERV